MKTNREGMTWAEWIRAAGRESQLASFSELNERQLAALRSAWKAGEDPAEYRAQKTRNRQDGKSYKPNTLVRESEDVQIWTSPSGVPHTIVRGRCATCGKLHRGVGEPTKRAGSRRYGFGSEYSFSECVNYETNSLGDCGGRAYKHGRKIMCETCFRRPSQRVIQGTSAGPGPGPGAKKKSSANRQISRLVRQRLVASQNTRAAERAVRSAATARFGRVRKDVFYEHGQWWVRVDPLGRAIDFSAVDTNRGIDFERV